MDPIHEINKQLARWPFWIMLWFVAGGLYFYAIQPGRVDPCTIFWGSVTLLTAAIALLNQYSGDRARGLRKAALARRQLCVNCGYDLRATDNRCPECGHDLAASRVRVEALEALVTPQQQVQPDENGTAADAPPITDTESEPSH